MLPHPDRPCSKIPGPSPPLGAHLASLTFILGPSVATRNAANVGSQNQDKNKRNRLPLSGGQGAGMRSWWGAGGLWVCGNLVTKGQSQSWGSSREGSFQPSGAVDVRSCPPESHGQEWVRWGEVGWGRGGGEGVCGRKKGFYGQEADRVT